MWQFFRKKRDGGKNFLSTYFPIWRLFSKTTNDYCKFFTFSSFQRFNYELRASLYDICLVIFDLSMPKNVNCIKPRAVSYFVSANILCKTLSHGRKNNKKSHYIVVIFHVITFSVLSNRVQQVPEAFFIHYDNIKLFAIVTFKRFDIHTKCNNFIKQTPH